MRQACGALVDALLVAVIGFAAVHTGEWATPCGPDRGNCFPLAPTVIATLVLGIATYLLIAHLIWGESVGRHVCRARRERPSEYDGHLADRQ